MDFETVMALAGFYVVVASPFYALTFITYRRLCALEASLNEHLKKSHGGVNHDR